MWEELKKRIQRKIIGGNVKIIDCDQGILKGLPPNQDFYRNSYLIVISWEHEGVPYSFRHIIRKEILDQIPSDVLLDYLTADIERQIDNIIQGS